MQFDFTEHPCLPPVTREQLELIVRQHGAKAPAVCVQIEHARKELIAKAGLDPLRCGFEFEWWKDADLIRTDEWHRLLAMLGGNGSAKTTYMVKRALQIAFAKKGAKVLLLHEDEDASIDVHQAMAYHFLPPEVKPQEGYKVKKSITMNIVYDTKNGFVGNSFTTPNGGKVQFGNYRQSIKRWEGGGWTFIGADENLPLSWLQTLLFRLGRAGGRMMWAFTAIDGITPAIDDIVRGAITERSRPVDERILPKTHRVSDDQDWPPGEMPYIQQAVRQEVKIIYPHSDMNPLAGYDPEAGRGAFYGYEDMVKLLQNRPTIERERRAYGYTRKTKGSAFPKFSPKHIVPAARMAEILAKEPVTRYQVVDPAGARNFFVIWFAVDAHGRHYIYREWPDVLTVGEWAMASDDPRKWDGKPGPGQDSLGFGISDYKRLFLQAEGWSLIENASADDNDMQQRLAERGIYLPDMGAWKLSAITEIIFQRFIDPRSGATEAMAADEGESSLIDRFLEEQHDQAGNIIGPSMEFEPAISGRSEDDGLSQINELLTYDQTQPIVALLNEPLLYVSEDCQNVIWSLQHYTAHDGPKAACKDPIDAVRYMTLKKCEHVQASALKGFAGGGWR